MESTNESQLPRSFRSGERAHAVFPSQAAITSSYLDWRRLCGRLGESPKHFNVPTGSEEPLFSRSHGPSGRGFVPLFFFLGPLNDTVSFSVYLRAVVRATSD